ncbi:MAG: GDP-mannose 4,6-dehydratase [Patescibacteria group bacterium]|jgi:GDP-4-dehydro-6-deoxy-D-mannose reductase
MKILITGITGFVGSHLADFLLNSKDPLLQGLELHGIKRWRSKVDIIGQLEGKVEFHECDLKDPHNVYQVIETIRPDIIFHLAAQSFVPTSWASPAETLEINIVGQCNLFEAVVKLRDSGYDPVIQIACSSEEYGLVYENEVPIKETNPLRPLSPYAVSKIGQDYLGYQYARSHGLRVIRTRAFNHSGPRRGEVFVDSNFAKQIVEIERGMKEPVIHVGNLEALRDFTDVRDIVRAYWLAVQKCEAGEVYNIASGTAYKISDVLNHLISLSTVKNIKIQQDPSRMRPSDVPVLIGDFSLFQKTTGWKPEIDYMKKTLPDTLEWWRTKLA